MGCTLRETDVEVLFFDLDDTLYDLVSVKREVESLMLTKIGKMVNLPFKRVFEVFKSVKKSFYKTYYPSFLIHRKDLLFKRLLRKLGVEEARQMSKQLSEEYWSCIIRGIKPYPDVKPALTKLKEEGFTLGLLSNGLRKVQMLKLQRLGLDGFFDVTVTSEDVGVEKPDKRVFMYALEEVEVKPDKAVMVGDIVYIDVLGANRVGMWSVWVKRGFYANVKPRKPGEHPSFTVKDLIEVLSLVMRKGG